MKERPILFSTDMVRAITNGKKTQTRRIMQPQPWYLPEAYDRFSGWMWTRNGTGDGEGLAWGSEADVRHVSYSLGVYCPYGQPGDRLWVRESIGIHVQPSDELEGVCIYRADLPDGPDVTFAPHWTPSIHMPRWASRITLEVVSVRVQRLQGITSEDAQAEGIEVDICDNAIVTRDYSRKEKWFQMWSDDLPNYVDIEQIAQASFRSLWDHINGKREGFAWDDNPWVWAVEFKTVEVKPSKYFRA